MNDIELSLAINEPFWQTVYEIHQSNFLLKGRHGSYHAIVEAAGNIKSRFGCYGWGTSENLFYIGSFSKDYTHGDHKSNFHGRIHNYLQNHRLKESGQKNTNLLVFENINHALLANNVILYILCFDSIQIGQEQIDYSCYAQSPELVRAVEQLLICSYKRNNQCSWNRE
jgi:hypothetical protein